MFRALVEFRRSKCPASWVSFLSWLLKPLLSHIMPPGLLLQALAELWIWFRQWWQPRVPSARSLSLLPGVFTQKESSLKLSQGHLCPFSVKASHPLASQEPNAVPEIIESINRATPIRLQNSLVCSFLPFLQLSFICSLVHSCRGHLVRPYYVSDSWLSGKHTKVTEPI